MTTTRQRHARTHPAARRGSVIVAIIVALVMLQIVVLGVVVLGARNQDLTTRRLEDARALYAAESAANMAIREIASGVDDDGDGTVGSISSGNTSTGPTVNYAQCAAALSLSGNTYTVTTTGVSNLASHSVQFSATRTPAAPGQAGLYTEYYALGSGPGSCASVNYAAPTAAGILPNVDLVNSASGTTRWAGGASHLFAIRYTGKINIPAVGSWTFWTNSDDGSRLYINGSLIVNNDGDHSAQSASGTVTLAAGLADFVVQYYENTGASVCTAYWKGPTVGSQTIIPASAFTCAPTQTVPSLAGATSVTLTGTGGTLGDLNVDGFDSSVGAYGGSNIITSGYAVATNSIASHALTVSAKARVQGDAAVGVGGSTATVVYTPTSGSITGSKSVATVNVGIGSPNIPPGMPSSIGNQTVSSSVTVNTNYHAGTVVFSGSGTVITISGNLIIQIDGDLTITNSVQLKILPGSSLTLFVAGNMTCQLTSQCNMTTSDPTCLVIYMMLGAANTFSVIDSAQVCATVYNPWGGFTFTGNGTPPAVFYGVYLGDSITMSQKAKFHMDTLFGSSTSSLTGSTSLLYWIQTR